MAALSTVGEYLAEARTLLQDTVSPYRYADADIVSALNIGLLEARRLRADLFYPFDMDIGAYSTAQLGAGVTMDFQYRSALLYYIIGRIELRDGEPDKDVRAAALLKTFVGQMISLGA